MANVKISGLTAITSADDLADADIIPLVDSSDSTTKRTALSVLCSYFGGGGGGSSVWCTGTNTAYLLTDCVGIGTATPGTDIMFRVQGDSCYTGDLKIGGDVCIGGDDLFMGTNTSGHMLIADGTNFNPVAMSGDVGIDSAGATTIQATSVENSMLAGSIANAKLSNSSVSYGGISLSLGGTDATPAFNLCDATGYKTSNLAGTITNSQLAGSIANSKLANDSVSYGGVSVDLGSTDATPAFNLCDATAYKGDSALVTVGTIASGVWNGTAIANGYLANSSITLSDGSNTTAISLGGTMTFSGTSNEIEVAESSGTVTIGLPACVTGLTTICATNFAGTLATAAQTNVTSLGTLTALTASGNVSFDGGTFVFNESGADLDFRIEGDSDANLLIADASTDRIGIGTATPDYLLSVAGNAGFNEYIYHNGDADTYIRMRGDQFDFVAGNMTFLTLDESSGASADTVTVNHGDNDIDFLVNSDDGTQLIRTDAENNRVGIGTEAPATMLHVQGDTCVTGAVNVGGDLTISGDDLIMGTNTSGYLLVADGTNYNPVAVSGDVTINSSGAVTIAATSVENSMLAGSIANAKLSNSSVSYGGVSVSLGSTDATPAFNLCDATAYKGDSALVTVGTVTSGTWQGTAIATAYVAGTICDKTLASPVLCGTISGNAFLDEDNMASDSASKVASQQSIKAYVDSVASGLDLKCSSHAATTANLSAAYSNGSSGVGATLTNNSTQAALSIDGQTMAADERVLVKDQSTAAQNGIYTVTTVGDGSSNWVLTRATDFDTSTEITSGAFTFVETGSSYADSGWVMTTDGTVTVGTTSLAWSQFSGAGQITAGDGLTKSGNTLNVGAGSNLLVSADAVAMCSIVTGLTTVCATNFAGTLATAAQANVTSLGTLTALTVDNICLDGATIGHTSDTDLVTLADGAVTIAGDLTATGDISFDGGTFVFNESGADKDFRVEGDSDANLFIADASTDRIGIGTATPDYLLSVAGNAGFDEYLYHNGDADTSIRFMTDIIDLRAGNWSMIKIDQDNNKVTVNNANQNVDFRVNSDDGTQLIRTDAGNNRVGIGTGSPSHLLDVEGVAHFATCIVTPTVCTTGDTVIGGDLTVLGDDITMGTNTSGHILVADGTNYNPVAVSGDVTISSAGAVTIAATSVENSMLAGSIANAKLSNSSVSYGGISLSLGGTDATPAFNLCDATAYKGDSALVTVGTITSGTWNGTAIAAAYVAAAQTNITSLGTLTALTVDNICLNGTTIGHTDDTDLMTLADGVLTVSGRLDAASDIKVDAIRRYSDSSTTTKILLNDEVIKLNAGHASNEVVKIASGAVTIDGDLTICGDDLVMGTNTSGHILVADGTNYNPVAVSGDVTISNTGAVTIAATSVENSMLAGSIANAKLANDSVSYGGVSLDLGGTDATPAFNLCDATAYKGDSALVTSGALNSGSITSGFGNIDNGSSTLDTGTATVSSLSVGDGNITNVGDIAVDTISSDASTSIGITLGTDAGDDLLVGTDKLVVEGDTGNVGIGTAAPEEALDVYRSPVADTWIQVVNPTNHNIDIGFRAEAYPADGTDYIKMFARNDDNTQHIDFSHTLSIDEAGAAVMTLAAGNVDIGGCILNNANGAGFYVGADCIASFYAVAGYATVRSFTCPLYLMGTEVGLLKGDLTETYLIGCENAGVEIYYDNSKKFETTADGASISDGNGLVVGHTALLSTGSTSELQVIGTTTADSSMSIQNFQADALAGAYLFGAHSRGGVGSYTILQDDDKIFSIRAQGADGTDAATVAGEIVFLVDGTPGSNDMPGRIEFKTTADGASSSTTRMIIDNAGKVGIGGTPSYKLDIAETAASPAFHLLNSNASDSFGLQICAGNDANDYAARIQDRTGTDLFKIQGDGNTILKPPDGGGLKFYAGGTGHGNYIRWSDDSGSNNQGSFGYDHSTDDAMLYTAGNLNWTFHGDGNLQGHNGKFKSTADNQGFYTGASDDLRMFHDATNSCVSSCTGGLNLQGGNFSSVVAIGGNYPLYASGSTGANYGTYLNHTFTGTSAAAVYLTPTFCPSSGSNDNIVAAHGTTSANNTGAVKAFWSYHTVSSGITLATHYGMYVGNPAGSGTLTNNYGIYIESLAKGTSNNYAIYSAGGASYFAGAMTIGGALSKGSGSFRVEHPLESKKDTHQLVHSFIEGPQADLQYRGVVQLVDGSAQINIDTVSDMTAGTFVALNRCVQVFTTNESNWDAVRGSVTGNILTIESNTTDSTACISWMVVGERCDQHMMDTEWTHSDGRVIVEPEKTE